VRSGRDYRYWQNISHFYEGPRLAVKPTLAPFQYIIKSSLPRDKAVTLKACYIQLMPKLGVSNGVSLHVVQREKFLFPFLGTFAKLRKADISFASSVGLCVHPSVCMEQLGSHLMYFHGVLYFLYSSQMCPENLIFIKIL
jgi:hypothetical protein